MEPVMAPLMPECRLALCYLVCMMREHIIYTAAVNIKILATVLLGYAGALNMPAGIADAERRIPFQLLRIKF